MVIILRQSLLSCIKFTLFTAVNDYDDHWSTIVLLGTSVRGKCPGQVSGTSVRDKCPGQMSGTSVWDNCPGQVSGTNVRDKCPGQACPLTVTSNTTSHSTAYWAGCQTPDWHIARIITTHRIAAHHDNPR